MELFITTAVCLSLSFSRALLSRCSTRVVHARPNGDNSGYSDIASFLEVPGTCKYTTHLGGVDGMEL